MEPETRAINWVLSMDDKISRPLDTLDSLQRKFVNTVANLGTKSRESFRAFTKGAEEGNRGMGILQKTDQGFLKVIDAGLGALGRAMKFAGAAISGVIGMMISSAKAAMEYKQETLLLNQAMAMTSKEYGTAVGLVDKWWATLGYSRQEAAATVRVGLELGIMAQKGGAAFKTWTDQTMILARATGESTQAVGEFYWQMSEVYGLGTGPLYRLGSAVKYIGDKTAISHGELMGMGKSIEDLLIMTGKSGKGVEDYTIRTQALAGAFKNAGIDFQPYISGLTSMMELTGEAGIKQRSALTSILGLTPQAIREMVKNTPETLLGALSDAVKNAPPVGTEQGEVFRKRIAEGLGIGNWQEIEKLARLDARGLQVFVNEALKAGEVGGAAKKGAGKTVDRTVEEFNRLKKEVRLLWVGLGNEVLEVFETRILPHVRNFTNMISKNRGEIAKTAGEWLDKGIAQLEKLDKVLDRVKGGLGEIKAGWIEAYKAFEETGGKKGFWDNLVSNYKQAWTTVRNWMNINIFEFMEKKWDEAAAAIRPILVRLGILEAEPGDTSTVIGGATGKGPPKGAYERLRYWADGGDKSLEVSSVPTSSLWWLENAEKDMVEDVAKAKARVRDAVEWEESLSRTRKDSADELWRDLEDGTKKTSRTIKTSTGNVLKVIEGEAQNVSSRVKGMFELPEWAKNAGQGAQWAAGDNAKALYDPKTNINLGAAYLSKLMKMFEDPNAAVAAYNWGMGNVRGYTKKHGGVTEAMPGASYAADVLQVARTLGYDWGGEITGKATRAHKVLPLTGKHTEFDEMFQGAGKQYGVDWRLLKALAGVESYYKPGARSSAGAHGLMQIKPGTALDMAREAGIPLTGTPTADGAIAAQIDDTNIVGGLRAIYQILKDIRDGDSNKKRPKGEPMAPTGNPKGDKIGRVAAGGDQGMSPYDRY